MAASMTEKGFVLEKPVATDIPCYNNKKGNQGCNRRVAL